MDLNEHDPALPPNTAGKWPFTTEDQMARHLAHLRSLVSDSIVCSDSDQCIGKIRQDAYNAAENAACEGRRVIDGGHRLTQRWPRSRIYGIQYEGVHEAMATLGSGSYALRLAVRSIGRALYSERQPHDSSEDFIRQQVGVGASIAVLALTRELPFLQRRRMMLAYRLLRNGATVS